MKQIIELKKNIQSLSPSGIEPQTFHNGILYRDVTISTAMSDIFAHGVFTITRFLQHAYATS